MLGDTANISESWRRIAQVKCCLSSSVKARRRVIRGRRWHVLHDPFNTVFLRIPPETWAFIVRLKMDCTIEEVLRQYRTKYPEEKLDRDEVVRVLTRLRQANLLRFQDNRYSDLFYQNWEKREKTKWAARLMSLVVVRLPLFDPDPLLVRLLPLGRMLFNRFMVVVWLIVILLGVRAIIENIDLAADQAQGVINPDNLPLLYLAFIFIKIIHELGHAMACRHYGGEVHGVGIFLLVFMPLPYVDATSSWAFTSRRKRILVGASGMLFELFIGALAALLWAKTDSGLLHGLAYNAMFVATVSTLLFNANPLLKFDGYFMLSDILDIPNMYQRAQQQYYYLLEKYLLRAKDLSGPGDSLSEAIWLGFYGILSALYRLLVFVGIFFFVVDKYFLLGIFMAFTLLLSWTVVPLLKIFRYLSSSPNLKGRRLQAMAIVGATAGVVAVLIGVIPVDRQIRAPGVLTASLFVEMTVDVSGQLQKILKQPGTVVKTGEPLLLLKAPQLAWNLAEAKANAQQITALIRQAKVDKSEDLKPLYKQHQSTLEQIGELERRIAALTVRARGDGVWAMAQQATAQGVWFNRGDGVGWIVNPEQYEFSVVVEQQKASELFEEPILKAEIRLYGEAGLVMAADSPLLVPHEQDQLPSPALGWSGGGEIAVAMDDQLGAKAARPFFLLRKKKKKIVDVTLIHGRTGQIRLTLPAKPLIAQWEEEVRAFLQDRYRL